MRVPPVCAARTLHVFSSSRTRAAIGVDPALACTSDRPGILSGDQGHGRKLRVDPRHTCRRDSASSLGPGATSSPHHRDHLGGQRAVSQTPRTSRLERMVMIKLNCVISIFYDSFSFEDLGNFTFKI